MIFHLAELPWDAPKSGDRLYRNWKERQITTSPWNKIDTLALCEFVVTVSFCMCRWYTHYLNTTVAGRNGKPFTI